MNIDKIAPAEPKINTILTCCGSKKSLSTSMDEFENMVEYIIDTKSMDEAVSAAYKISSSGDCVLLSPACASFDLFDDFEDRGRQFKASVRKL